MVILLSAVTAIAFGSGSVLAKRGMQHTSTLAGLIIVSAVSATIFGLVLLLNPPDNVTIAAVGLFVAAGLAGDGVGRFSMFGAVDRLGPSTAIPIQVSVYPLVALSGGVLFLSETVALLQVFGAMAIVTGIWVLLAPASGSDGATDATNPRPGVRRWVLILPVIAGVGFAVSDLFRKSGLNETPNPAFGAFVAMVVVLILLVFAAASIPSLRQQALNRDGWGWFVVAGFSFTVGLLAMFEALKRGTVSVVAPIIASQPLVVVILSWALLHDIERVTRRMVAGAMLVVAGVTLIAVGN